MQPELIQEARNLLRQTRSGALATLANGSPFTSLVTLADDVDGSPIFLFSRLSAHTQNLASDPRCSLLLVQTGKGDPLAHPRLTVNGTAHKSDAPHLRDVFLKANPKSKLYIDFPDFAFYKMQVADFHLNGGFARAANFAARDVLGVQDNAG